MEEAKQRLLQLFKQEAVKFGEFQLSAGGRSNFYIDGKKITFHPEGSYLIGKILTTILREREIESIGGLSLGADPIVTAVAVVSQLEKYPISAFIVRKEPKKHGLQKHIEGCFNPDKPVAIVDDVRTTGTSTMKAITTVEKAGGKVKLVLSLVDRMERDEYGLKKKYPYVSLFTLKELGVGSGIGENAGSEVLLSG
jgi:orotate phosphoribosyltransferase